MMINLVLSKLFINIKSSNLIGQLQLQTSLYIMDTVSLLYRGVLYVEVILYSKECNWYTRCCPLNGGVRYRECPLREAILYMYMNEVQY